MSIASTCLGCLARLKRVNSTSILFLPCIIPRHPRLQVPIANNDRAGTDCCCDTHPAIFRYDSKRRRLSSYAWCCRVPSVSRFAPDTHSETRESAFHSSYSCRANCSCLRCQHSRLAYRLQPAVDLAHARSCRARRHTFDNTRGLSFCKSPVSHAMLVSISPVLAVGQSAGHPASPHNGHAYALCRVFSRESFCPMRAAGFRSERIPTSRIALSSPPCPSGEFLIIVVSYPAATQLCFLIASLSRPDS
ncbi:hypothetical protein GGR52DRAFT_550963 [Hypoxylon sp. FL1284]|nr:hypothetical protein GGR52DRAFT_550963 [Hypoxylon sp. FL1284]